MKLIIRCLFVYLILHAIICIVLLHQWLACELGKSVALDSWIPPLIEKGADGFLILDWTGQKHIFHEPSKIFCNFSHVNERFCHGNFQWLTNFTLQNFLIDRCLKLRSLKIQWTIDRSLLTQADLVVFRSINFVNEPMPNLKRNAQEQQYSLIFDQESEIKSTSRISWKLFDFTLWYNLERSYPVPMTYFDIQIYLKALFSPVIRSFTEKSRRAPVVMIISDCQSYNGREIFINELMKYIAVDSFGSCLNNQVKRIAKTSNDHSNRLTYSSYKFVLTIEDSNCEDYVTEILTEAFASTAVPIVASRHEKPNYLRFAPTHSFINVYDFKSVEDLANYLNHLSQNQTAYDEYLWFRPKTWINHADPEITNTFGVDSPFYKGLLTKETNQNRYCQVVQFIYMNHWDSIYNRKREERPKPNQVCLPEKDLSQYFQLS